MIGHRLSPAAAVMAVGAVVLLVWSFRDQLAHLLEIAVFARVLWAIARVKLGLPRRERTRRTLLELALGAGVGGWLVARRRAPR